MIKSQHIKAFFQKHNKGRFWGDSEEMYVFQKVFHEDELEASYNKLKVFLEEEGFGYLAIPRDADELYLLSDKEAGIVSFEVPPVSISLSAYHESHIILSIGNVNYPNYRFISHDEAQKLKSQRIKEVLEFVADKIKAIEPTSNIIPLSRLEEIAQAMQEVNLRKTTILGALLQNGYSNDLFTVDEVANKFGIDVAEAMFYNANETF